MDNIDAKNMAKKDFRIKQMGTLLKIDRDGFIVNASSKEKIVAPWSEVVNEMVSVCLQNNENDIHSIYLRGSVSRGEAIKGVSDVDLIVITKVPRDELGLQWIQKEKERLSKEYPFSKGFEFIFIERDKLEGKKGILERFDMKTQYVNVYGPDLLPSIEKFKPSNKIASGKLANFKKSLEKSKRWLEQDPSPEQITKISRWISKRILRNGFYLVMNRANTFTKDLYPAYEKIAEFYPEKDKDFYKVLEMAINPSSSKEVIQKIMDTIGVWLQEEIAKVYPK